jgi:hypothetical protein
MMVFDSAQAERTKVREEPKMYHNYHNWRTEMADEE